MSGRSAYRQASDRLLARESGPWAKQKLDALAGYLRIFTTAMRGKWPALCYVDLLAGPGRCILKDGNREFAGSPLIALNGQNFDQVVLVEENPSLAAALRQRTASHAAKVTIIEGNCNDSETIRLVRAAVPGGSLAVLFIDNLGLDVTLSTISNIVYRRRMDLLVTFQTNDVRRNAGRALKEANISRKWDQFFSSGKWRDVIHDAEARRLPTADIGTALGDLYASRLKTLGYAYRTQLSESMKNMRNAPLYRVMLFSRHPLAKKLFDVVSDRSGEPRLQFGDG